MSEPFQHLEVEHVKDVVCVRLREPRLALGALEQLLTEIDRIVSEQAARKMVLCLGPAEPECLYSLFLAKLVTLHKRLQKEGGGLKIAEASETVQKIFEACRLRDFFEFVPDRNTAVADFHD